MYNSLCNFIPGTTCQFEKSTNSKCGWRNTIRDNINWKLNSGKTPTSRTGPITDHSVGTPQGLLFNIRQHYFFQRNSFESFFFIFDGEFFLLLSNILPKDV